MDTGDIYGFGANNAGQVGTRDISPKPGPNYLGGLTSVSSLGLGDQQTFIIEKDGSCICFGSNIVLLRIVYSRMVDWGWIWLIIVNLFVWNHLLQVESPRLRLGMTILFF